jgi:lipopolysaccharide export system protein LptA
MPPGGASQAPARQAIPTGLVSIESDLQQADQATGVITATGNVRILYPDKGVMATARQAQYFTREGRVVLSGDVDVAQQDGSLLRAEQVTYLVRSERITARPATQQQVLSRLRLTPAPKPATATAPVTPGATGAMGQPATRPVAP